MHLKMSKPIKPIISMEDGDGVSKSAEVITIAVLYFADIFDYYMKKYFEERYANPILRD